MFSKILVANRGEIAIRAFRAATELGVATVAVYAHEDRYSEHRLRADEAYEIGHRGSPVRAYLDIDAILRVARQAGADAVYPGYGFLAENPELAEACAAAGVTFIGPPAETLRMAGNKVEAIASARAAGLPVLASTPPSTDTAALAAQAAEIGFPVFVKAVAGGGGRGMREVTDPEALTGAIKAAMREADSAFGDPTVFIEQAVRRPRHVEVQILADSTGQVVHLYERDCSVQRRHQKVIEMAPAPNLDPDIRERLCSDAVAFARAIGYVGAGTVEFLLDTEGDRAGRHVFIEMNPRIQVEHTVTEEITDIDLVQAQIRVAAGETLEQMGITQDGIVPRGAAIQCRITTEDPANDFRPDSGRVTSYRSPGGAGIRLDGGTLATGVDVSPYFDSLLVKLVARGQDLSTAVRRVRRALGEIRISGVETNIPFLSAVVADPEFLAGNVSTRFIPERPELLTAASDGDPASKLAAFLAEVTINPPHPRPPHVLDAREKLPDVSLTGSVPDGSHQELEEYGPEVFARRLRARLPVAITDTTFRDAHQSLLATRVRTIDLAHIAPYIARMTPQLLSVEAWGGATYDVALRFLGEDPWERLSQLRELMPNVALQMLLRGRNTVGYTPYPTEVTDAFVDEAARSGIDIFRIFDALNDVTQMRPAVEAVRATGTGVAEVAMCYAGNLADPGERLYTLDYYLRLAEEIVEAGAHVLAIKDMAGLMRPVAARKLVTALRERFDLPVHLHTHDTVGGQVGTLLAAIDAGVDAVDTASAPMAGTTSQPSMSALVAALEGTVRDPGLSLTAVTDLEPYWEAVRDEYIPFSSGLRAPTGRAYRHEIPGGQLTNLRQQAIALGLGDRFETIEHAYAEADRMLGHIVKVTPSSKVVGDLALHLAATGADPADFEKNPRDYDLPDSVVGFLHGDLGTPPGGWPEPFRAKALEGREYTPPSTHLDTADAAVIAQAGPKRRRTLNRLLFPSPTSTYETTLERFSDISLVPTPIFLYGLHEDEEIEIDDGAGHSVIARFESASEPDERGVRQVMLRMNGQLRTVAVLDRSVPVEVTEAEKADLTDPHHVAAPFAGSVTVKVAPGDTVGEGEVIATIEAMKMEASITTHLGGTVARTAVGAHAAVEAGDLIAVIA